MSPLPPSQRIYQASFCFPARAEKRVHLSENCSPLPPLLPFLIVTVHSPCTMIRTLSPTTNGYCTPLNALGLSASSPSSILSCYMLKGKKYISKQYYLHDRGMLQELCTLLLPFRLWASICSVTSFLRFRRAAL